MKQNVKAHKSYFSTDCKSEDDAQMVIDHAISDDVEDRDGDDIMLDAWDTENYLRNPVVCEAHNQGQPVIGKCIAIYKQGNQLRAKTQFAPTERGKMFYELYKGGFMSAFSVGFIPKSMEPKNNARGMHITGCELLEYSCVAVPSNPRATKEMDEETLEKSGAVMSKANLALLKQASELLSQVIQNAEGEKLDDEPGDDLEKGVKGDPQKADEPEPATLENMLLEALKD